MPGVSLRAKRSKYADMVIGNGTYTQRNQDLSTISSYVKRSADGKSEDNFNSESKKS